MSIGTIILIILVIALLGGFSGLGGGPFYGTGYYHRLARMSAIGTKRTCACALQMSAIGGKADMTIASQNVR